MTDRGGDADGHPNRAAGYGDAHAPTHPHRHARPGVRGGRRVCGSRQCGGEHHGGSPVRLSAGVGTGAGEHDVGPHPIPVRQTRHRHRQIAAAAARRADGRRGAVPVLRPGRGHRHRHRSGRTDRRGDCAAPAVRSTAVRRRLHHRRGLHAAVAIPGRAHASTVRTDRHRPAAGYHARFRGRPAGRPAGSDRGRAGTGATVHNHRLGAHCHVDAGRDGDAARDLSALDAGQRPLR